LDSLPKGWRAGYVGDFAKTIESGFASGEHNQIGAGIPHLRPMNVDRNGKIDLTTVKFVAASKNARRLAVGEVLFNNTNSPELVGKTAVFNKEGDFAFSNHMTRVLFNEEVVPKFAAIQLHYLWMRGYFRYNCVKHVNQASVSSGTLARAVPFIWAPVTEQERIVAEIEKQFSRLDRAVEGLRAVQTRLQHYRSAILFAACNGLLISRRDPWRRTVLGELLQFIEAGKSFKCVERPPTSSEVGVVKVSAVTWGEYDEDESKTCGDTGRFDERFLVRPEDFLFSRANTIELVGACVIAKRVTRRVMLSDKILRFRFSSEVYPRWVLFWLPSRFVRMEIERLATGNQESMRNIGQDRIRQIAIDLPSLAEQRSIVSEIEHRFSVVGELTAEVGSALSRAMALRGSVLARWFSSH